MYLIDPSDGTVLQPGCVTSIDGIDTSIEQVDVTCLEDLTRQFMAGLATPGSATFGIHSDPQDTTHVRLHAIKVAGLSVQWAVGWSDGKGIAPTVTTDSAGDKEFVLPATRSWLTFEGFMNAFPFNFAQNGVVDSTVGIQVSGEPIWTAKTP